MPSRIHFFQSNDPLAKRIATKRERPGGSNVGGVSKQIYSGTSP
ncbi:hypothetical protein RBWH47_03408 [Rhodopirellula baltica WH47]|uniref:Uncharacterized protein n=1 Tax=Rhodopirellula baltica WH47 TaxID=991778 RepID=F2AZF7_RHOBT|nr:hypothetical protein RBWH47_03408 [Rhodopirellula baltica WH47]